MKKIKYFFSLLLLAVTFVQPSYAHRYFDSWCARWTTPDPALRDRDPQQQIKKYGYKLFEESPYGYCSDNPLKYVDPDGKQGQLGIGGPILLARSWKELEYRVIGTAIEGAALAAAYYAPSATVKAVQWALANPATTAAVSTGVTQALAPAGSTLTPMGAESNLVSGEAKEISEVVLGKFPDYVNLGEQTGAKIFNISSDVWNRMSAAEQWQANVKFLDDAIANEDKIVLSNPVKNLNDVSGTFRKELDYLIQKGYKLNDEGTQMVK
jgi:RHS repeat-associated protein